MLEKDNSKKEIKKEIKKLEKIIEDKDSSGKEIAEAYKKIMTIYPEISGEMYPVKVFVKEVPYGKPGANRKKSRKPLEMGGLLQDDEERMGYSTGDEVYDPRKAFEASVAADIKRNAVLATTPQKPKGTVGKVLEKVIGNDVEGMIKMAAKDSARTAKQIPGVSDQYKSEEYYITAINEEIKNINSSKKADKIVSEVRETKVYGGTPKKRMGYAEGSLLADDMPMMEEEQETHMMPDGTEMPGATHGETLEPDSEMEDGYLDYILGEALSTEEEDMLMSKLEQDGELSVLFDKVVGVAQEFAGSGPVEGPGSGTSDSIPARLSDGEFVFTAKAVEEIGADNLKAMMDEAEMKAGERQGFAEGDVVEEDNVTMPVEKQPMKQDIRVTKETVGAQAGMLEQSDLVDDEVKKSMFRQNRFLG